MEHGKVDQEENSVNFESVPLKRMEAGETESRVKHFCREYEPL
jgi:hypothetical protein